MSRDRVVMVCGSTGRQGGAVARRLLRDGWEVRALTRHPESAAARALTAAGARVVRGDLSAPDSLAAALDGAGAVFGVTEFWEHGLRTEILHGRGLIDAARRAGVERFVFSSVGGTDRTEGLGISHFDSKRAIEAHLRGSGLDWTILRPVTFFENFSSPRYRRTIRERGVFQFAFAPGKSFQMVAMDDLAVFVARALADRPRFRARAIEIASDRFTMEEMCAALARAVGRPVRYRFLTPAIQWAVASYVTLTRQTGRFKVGLSLIDQFRWNNRSEVGGWDADLAALRAIHPGLSTVDAWARSIDWGDRPAAATVPITP
jgi:uncharacterized protein YbjT (DUF2867 family)